MLLTTERNECGSDVGSLSGEDENTMELGARGAIACAFASAWLHDIGKPLELIHPSYGPMYRINQEESKTFFIFQEKVHKQKINFVTYDPLFVLFMEQYKNNFKGIKIKVTTNMPDNFNVCVVPEEIKVCYDDWRDDFIALRIN